MTKERIIHDQCELILVQGKILKQERSHQQLANEESRVKNKLEEISVMTANS